MTVEEIRKGDQVTHPSEPGRVGTVEAVEFDRAFKQTVYLVRWPHWSWAIPYRSGLAKVLDLDTMKPLELVQSAQRELGKLREAATDDRPVKNLSQTELIITACLDRAGSILDAAERKLRGPERHPCPVCKRPIAVSDGKFVYHGKPKSNTICRGWGEPIGSSEESTDGCGAAS
ncbi:hypothetical protein ACI2L4_25085 [Streptomyces sparsogenes]|uniref:hypothetical protein n=1 Tax=Streptomyces sparsogenes TaxID=67365 RepID=UPI003851735F